MNCKLAQRALLLETAGELSSARRTDLAGHLADCGACREYRAFLTGDLPAMAAALAPPAPTAAMIRNVVDAARELRGQTRAVAFPRRLTWAAAGLAAGLCLAFGLWWRAVPGLPRETPSLHMATLVAMLEEDASAVTEPPRTEQERLRRLGQRLLELEGLSSEITDAVFSDDPDLQELMGPTDLLLHNTDVTRARIYG